MAIDVTCPPYPTRVTTPAMQHKMLLELYDWWASQLTESRRVLHGLPTQMCNKLFPDITHAELLRVFSVSSVKVESNFQRYLNVSVEAMGLAHTAMRAVRERYDDLLRNFENNWDCPEAILLRLTLLRATQFILSVAFLSAELFEPREDTEMKRQHELYVRNLRTSVQDLQAHVEEDFKKRCSISVPHRRAKAELCGDNNYGIFQLLGRLTDYDPTSSSAQGDSRYAASCLF